MATEQFDYKKYLDLVLRKRWIFSGTALIVMTLFVITAYLLPKEYEAKSTVFIEKNILAELVKGIAVTSSMEQTIKVLTYAMTSRTLVEKVVKELDMDTKITPAAIEHQIDTLRKNIKITVGKENTLFTISYRDRDPRIARDFVNTLVRVYIEQNVSSKREESYGAIQFFSEQVDTVKEKLEKADQEVSQFKAQQGGVVNIDEAKLFEEINASEQKLHDIQLRRRHLEGLKPVTRREADPLQNQMLSLQKRRDELRAQFNDNYPELIRLNGEIESLQLQIRNRPAGSIVAADPQEVAKIEAELNALKITEQGLQHYIAKNRALLSKIPVTKAVLEQKEVEKRKQKELYDQLLSRQGQSEVSKQMEVQDKTTTFRIVDPAVLPATPASPDRLRIMVMGVIAGLASGIGLLLLLDMFDNSIKSSDSIKSIGLPILAVIPRIPDVQAELKIQKKNRVFTLCSIVYFCVVLLVIMLEAAGFTFIDRMFAPISSMF